jgi:hypothetical protein
MWLLAFVPMFSAGFWEPRPNDDDYNLNPPTHDREFYQQNEELPGILEIDLTGEIEMEVDEE